MSFNKKIYLSITAFSLFYILLIVFVIFPIFQEIKVSSQQLQLAKDKFNLLILQEKEKRNSQELFKSYQPKIERIEGTFINPDLPLDLINFLEETASNSHVQMNISSLTKAVQKDPWPSLLLQISIIGPFPNSLQFLEKLENSFYLIEILNFNAQKLMEEEMKVKEIPLADAKIDLSLKVFTK